MGDGLHEEGLERERGAIFFNFGETAVDDIPNPWDRERSFGDVGR